MSTKVKRKKIGNKKNKNWPSWQVTLSDSQKMTISMSSIFNKNGPKDRKNKIKLISSSKTSNKIINIAKLSQTVSRAPIKSRKSTYPNKNNPKNLLQILSAKRQNSKLKKFMISQLIQQPTPEVN